MFRIQLSINCPNMYKIEPKLGIRTVQKLIMSNLES